MKHSRFADHGGSNEVGLTLKSLKYVAANVDIQRIMQIKLGKLYSNNYMFIIKSFRGSTELK